MFTIYTQDNCGYCTKAKALLDKKGLTYKEVKLTADTKAEFITRTNRAKTVPQIFYEGAATDVHVGGFDKLEAFVEMWWNDRPSVQEAQTVHA